MAQSLSAKWIATIETAIDDPSWDEQDATIRSEVGSYNQRFANSPGYATVDWLWIKAVVWIESGGPSNPAWKTRTMQIGNPQDPALSVLLKGSEGADIIMSKEVAQLVKASIDQPTPNIRAGIAYLFTRMALYGVQSVLSSDTQEYTYIVQPGDILTTIASRNGTTVEELRTRNPSLDPRLLRPRQQLKFRKASMQRVITGWRPFNAATISDRYNGGGDPLYAAKLEYVLRSVFPKLKRAER